MCLEPRQQSHAVVQFDKNVHEIRRFVRKYSKVSIVDVINKRLYVNTDGNQYTADVGDYVIWDGLRVFVLPRKKLARYYNLEGIFK